MSDMTIIGIGIGIFLLFVFVVGCLRVGWRIGVHLNAPPRKRDDD